jgi:predicted AAA+ superfamily ATPase
LDIISLSHATVLNISNVARECQVERKSVESYIEILKDLLLAFTIPVFNKRAKRNLIRHVKFYLADPGIFNYLRPKGPLDAPERIAGQALEGLTAQHIRAWIDYSRSSAKLYYWMTKSGMEVDFVFYGENEFLALEVKRSASVHPIDLRPLKEFKQDYPEATPIFLNQGKEPIMVQGIACLPIEYFLKSLDPKLPTITSCLKL